MILTSRSRPLLAAEAEPGTCYDSYSRDYCNGH